MLNSNHSDEKRDSMEVNNGMIKKSVPIQMGVTEKVPEEPTTQELPRKSRKTLMAVLLIVIVAVACFGVVIWWYSQKPSPTQSQGFNTYSKYGFTFEYPKSMSITERGMLESTATSSSGMVIGELSNGEYEMVLAGWLSTVTAPDLEDSLTGGLEGMETEGTTVVEGQRVNSTTSGHTMMYQYFTATIEGETLNGIWGVWYCDTNDRFYQLGLMYSEQNMLPKFQQYLDSFTCH